MELLKQADIVVTNPPFSLFKEYVAQLIEYEKKFVIMDSPAHIGVRRGQYDLVAWLNVFINYHKKPGGELDRYARKWLGEPLPQLSAF